VPQAPGSWVRPAESCEVRQYNCAPPVEPQKKTQQQLPAACSGCTARPWQVAPACIRLLEVLAVYGTLQCFRAASCAQQPQPAENQGAPKVSSLLRQQQCDARSALRNAPNLQQSCRQQAILYVLSDAQIMAVLFKSKQLRATQPGYFATWGHSALGQPVDAVSPRPEESTLYLHTRRLFQSTLTPTGHSISLCCRRVPAACNALVECFRTQ
jgi:hypothetical protein